MLLGLPIAPASAGEAKLSRNDSMLRRTLCAVLGGGDGRRWMRWARDEGGGAGTSEDRLSPEEMGGVGGMLYKECTEPLKPDVRLPSKALARELGAD